MVMRIQTSFAQDSDKKISPKGKLYLVPTPIGNLDDMTFRAVQILKDVDLIAAEDTRHTQKLLNHFDISTKQLSFHEHNTRERIPELIKVLSEGQSVAQVSDAGMPSISDPGQELVSEVINSGYDVIPLPGANAALTALIASGISPQPFYFHGFLPRKTKDIKEILELLNQKTETLIVYESPYRVKNVLSICEDIFGKSRHVVLARELTKRYEEYIRGTVQEVNQYLQSDDAQFRGEFVIIIEGNKHLDLTNQAKEWENLSLKEHVDDIMKSKNVRDKIAIKEVATLRDIPKREVYAAYHNI